MAEFNFEGKFILTGELCTVTGLHIGGATEGIEIGGVENVVVKDPITGIPYIPGSSLKGKMRSLLEWALGQVLKNISKDKEGNPIAAPCSCGECDVCIIFGTAAEKAKSPTRLIVRDAKPTDSTVEKWKKELGENIYTEVKWENVIDRITSAATPRQIERVPANSVFHIEMIYDVYQKEDYDKLERVFQAMKLLEDSYLGGSGTRGSGKVKFQKLSVKWQERSYYTEGKNPEVLISDVSESDGKSAPEVAQKEIEKNQIFKKLKTQETTI